MDTRHHLEVIANKIEALTKTIQDTPNREGTLLAQTLAENIRLKESLARAHQELMQMRMDVTQDPVLRAVFMDMAKNPINK